VEKDTGHGRVDESFTSSPTLKSLHGFVKGGNWRSKSVSSETDLKNRRLGLDSEEPIYAVD